MNKSLCHSQVLSCASRGKYQETEFAYAQSASDSAELIASRPAWLYSFWNVLSKLSFRVLSLTVCIEVLYGFILFKVQSPVLNSTFR